MICPLMSWRQESDKMPYDCQKEKCAWWVKRKMVGSTEGDAPQCAIKRLAER